MYNGTGTGIQPQYQLTGENLFMCIRLFGVFLKFNATILAINCLCHVLKKSSINRFEMD